MIKIIFIVIEKNIIKQNFKYRATTNEYFFNLKDSETWSLKKNTMCGTLQ